MNTLTISTLRNNLADSIGEISDNRDYLLITNKGKITSALVNIDLFEDLLALGNKQYLMSIQKARKEYKKGDIFSHENAFGAI